MIGGWAQPVVAVAPPAIGCWLLWTRHNAGWRLPKPAEVKVYGDD